VISDEELMAYVDGELDPSARSRVEAAVAADSALQARVSEQQALRQRLSAHFDSVLAEPLPAALHALPGGAASRSAPPSRVRRRWHWQEWSAIAATLVIGVLLGPYVMRSSQPLPFVSAGGRVVAIGGLERALMAQTSGATEATGSGGTAIGLSFRTNTGEYCRTFAMNPGPAGLACREWGEWVVEVLARNPRARQGSAEAYRQAGTAFPAAIREAVEARISGEPLSASEEAAQAARGWRTDRP
jgi:hypothetical protein